MNFKLVKIPFTCEKLLSVYIYYSLSDAQGQIMPLTQRKPFDCIQMRIPVKLH